MSDRITETIAAHQPDDSGFSCTGCDWKPRNSSVTDPLEFAAHVVAALKAHRITLTQLPEPDDAEENGRLWFDDFAILVDRSKPNEIITDFRMGTEFKSRISTAGARSFAAALLAAAEAAETPTASYCLGCGGNFPHGHQCGRKAEK